jgi:acetyl esterase/lipase
MTVSYSTLTTATQFGGNAYHEFASQTDGTDKLLVILPGYGYTFEYPVLYYLRKAALELGYDVLSVQYGFQAAHVDMTSDTMPYVQEDVQAAFDTLPAHHYRQICVAGKSLGTFLAADLADKITAEHLSLILLTPIPGAVQMAGERPTLAVIGTADPRYTTDMIQNTPTLTWRVYDGLDHSLEKPGDWRASLTVLPEIIAACADFLAE